HQSLPLSRLRDVLHVEMRSRLNVVRAFNLSAAEVQARFIGPLRSAAKFTYEGHEWDPRKTRLKVFEGPPLEPHQLALGRAWQQVEKAGTDVSATMLGAATATSGATAEPLAGATATGASHPPVLGQLRERLIGRLSAGPVSLPEMLALAAELMPDYTASQQVAASQTVLWELLVEQRAQLSPSDR
ncbi:MAG TPA: hypothetical protein VME01_08255, partial [Solirubrobacteraceae bacterium]|nr:hypothetical protein [Solirubrobacteraceae bacterium]